MYRLCIGSFLSKVAYTPPLVLFVASVSTWHYPVNLADATIEFQRLFKELPFVWCGKGLSKPCFAP